MKKTVIILHMAVMGMRNKSILFALLVQLTSLSALAYDAQVGGIYYNLYGTEATVAPLAANHTNNRNAYSGTVVIPETITYEGTTYTVTAIGESAFRYCSNLSSVTIPGTVRAIGDYAFEQCTGLSRANFPSSVTYIGDAAFESCNLSAIAIPGSVAYIGSWAFAYNSNLSSITVDDGVGYISPSVFSRTKWLTNQPDGLIYVGRFAYQYKGTMPSGTSITIKDGTVGIVGYAFNNCSGLTSLSVPNSVKSIGTKAFEGTAWYSNQASGMVYAGRVAYQYKGTMPSGTSIAIKDGTVGIGGRAFYGCTGLASIVLPASVAYIGDETFSGCTGLTTVALPSKVTHLGWHAFEGCTGFSAIDIPESVEAIAPLAFYNCTGLTSVTVATPQPLYLPSGAFMNVTKGATLRVPWGSAGAYEAAPVWQDFKEIVESERPLGDINGDGRVTIADVTALVNIILGKD